MYVTPEHSVIAPAPLILAAVGGPPSPESTYPSLPARTPSWPVVMLRSRTTGLRRSPMYRSLPFAASEYGNCPIEIPGPVPTVPPAVTMSPGGPYRYGTTGADAADVGPTSQPFDGVTVNVKAWPGGSLMVVVVAAGAPRTQTGVSGVAPSYGMTS